MQPPTTLWYAAVESSGQAHDSAAFGWGRRLQGNPIVLTSNKLHTIHLDESRAEIVPARLARMRAHMETTRLGNSLVQLHHQASQTTDAAT